MPRSQFARLPCGWLFRRSCWQAVRFRLRSAASLPGQCAPPRQLSLVIRAEASADRRRRGSRRIDADHFAADGCNLLSALGVIGSQALSFSIRARFSESRKSQHARRYICSLISGRSQYSRWPFADPPRHWQDGCRELRSACLDGLDSAASRNVCCADHCLAGLARLWRLPAHLTEEIINPTRRMPSADAIASWCDAQILNDPRHEISPVNVLAHLDLTFALQVNETTAASKLRLICSIVRIRFRGKIGILHASRSDFVNTRGTMIYRDA